MRHLANSAAAILRPSSRFDLVRCGIASYGLDPAPGTTPDLGLVPAMTARATLALVKPIAAGAGVSYGHTWIADRDTTVGLVPAGYGDGVPRHAGNRAEAWVDGRRRPVRGRICMDQFVVDLDGDLPAPGSDVVLFGTGHDGEPTAQDWAEACETINYEIVTRIGGRMVRRYVHEEDQRLERRVASSQESPPARSVSRLPAPPSGSPVVAGSSPGAARATRRRSGRCGRRRSRSWPTTAYPSTSRWTSSPTGRPAAAGAPPWPTARP